MKRIAFKFSKINILLLFIVKMNAQVGIGTKIPDNSAQLEVSSSSKGFLPPRVTKAQRDAIANPAFGLIVFCTDCNTNGGGCLSQNTGSKTSPNWECIGASSTPSMTATCNGFVTGSYISGIAVNGSYTVTVTNNSFSTATISFSNTDIVLSGVSGLSVGTPTGVPALTAGSATLNSGASVLVTYPITGTPTTSGTLIGSWTKISLSCSKSKNIALGSANFASNSNAFVFSVNDISILPNVIHQGILPIGTTLNIPYTSGIGSYSAYNSSFVAIPSQFCEDGASDWTFGYSYNAGTFSTSGNIPVTLITKKAGVVSAWHAKRVSSVQTINFNCISLPWSNNGNSYSNTIGLDEGGDAIRGALAQAGCASCTSYDNAQINDMVAITQAEYDKLSDIVSGTIKGGVQNFSASLSNGLGGKTWVQNSTNPSFFKNLDTNSYVIGFAYASTGALSNAYFRLGCASAITGPYTTLTNYSGPFSFPAMTYVYYAIKRPNANCGNNTFFVGGTDMNGTIAGYPVGSGPNAYGGEASSSGITNSTFTGLSAWTPGYQFKFSKQKSW